MKKFFLLLFIFSITLFAYQAPQQLDGATTVDSEKAWKLYQSGTKFIDVRPKKFVLKGKIKGSYHLYVDFMNKESLGAIAKPSEAVLFYCNGRGCSLSAEAVIKARDLGYTTIFYYRDGYPAWEYYNLPISR